MIFDDPLLPPFLEFVDKINAAFDRKTHALIMVALNSALDDMPQHLITQLHLHPLPDQFSSKLSFLSADQIQYVLSALQTMVRTMAELNQPHPFCAPATPRRHHTTCRSKPN